MITGEFTEEMTTLLRRARSGESEAYTALYERFFPVARRTAGRFVRDQHEADDLTQEAFYMVFRALKAGRGPDESFIGYIQSTVRRLAFRHTAARNQVTVSDDLASYEPGTAAAQPSGKYLDDVAAAWASLPDRWRRVLWLIEVDRYSPAELADMFGMSPTAVSSLATRAREALRTAFLAQQVMDGAGQCAPFVARLAAFVRGTLANRWLPQLARHVDLCPHCQDRLETLIDNAERAGLITGPAPSLNLSR